MEEPKNSQKKIFPVKDPMCEYYEERRRDLEKIRSESIDSFDKAILEVSTGALVITITFIDKVGKPYDGFTNFILILFWALFLSVVIVNIFSYLFAKKNMDFRIKDLDKRYKDCPDDWTNIEPGKTWYKICVDFCNNISLYLFLAGAILFFFYAYMVQTHNFEKSNRKEEVSMTQKIKAVKEIKDNKGKPTERTSVEKGKAEPPERVILKPQPPKGKD
jgi:hypothetical protein